MGTLCTNCPLRRLEIFNSMSEQDVRAMDRFKVGELTVESGTPILLEGSNSLQLFTVLRGMGIRYKITRDGRRQVLNFVFPGDLIGLQGSLMKEMSHSIEARSKMTLCVFNRSDLFNFIHEHPQRGYDVTWMAAMQEHFLGEALTSVGQRSALQAVAWAILRLFERAQALEMTDEHTMRLPIRQQDLADALGLSLVHTNKTLGKLRERQLVGWSDGKITIPDPEKLANVAGIASEPKRQRPLM